MAGTADCTWISSFTGLKVSVSMFDFGFRLKQFDGYTPSNDAVRCEIWCIATPSRNFVHSAHTHALESTKALPVHKWSRIWRVVVDQVRVQVKKAKKQIES